MGGERTHASELVTPLNPELLKLDTVCCYLAHYALG